MSDREDLPVHPRSTAPSACCWPRPAPPQPCCGSAAPAGDDAFCQPFVNGGVDTPAGRVPRVPTSLTRCDRWGAIRARWGVGRMRYAVSPGLYAVGDPDPSSPVLVTANYKLSFDRLRASCEGLDVWILVLDTRGINVWCAAGKGTFGTDELVHRITASSLGAVVDHRHLVLPQLGAPGVAAHRVKKQSGFKVVWGPIRAEDLSRFLADAGRASPAMRRKTFGLGERAALVPMELVPAARTVVPIVLAVFLLGGLGGDAGYWRNALDHGLAGVLSLLGGVLAGAVLTPLLLPWLPGRAFALKGTWAGLALALLLVAARGPDLGAWPSRLEAASWVLMATSLAAFLAMNFTGSSTYTSLSGVRREMRFAVPLEIAGAVLGLGLWAGALWLMST